MSVRKERKFAYLNTLQDELLTPDAVSLIGISFLEVKAAHASIRELGLDPNDFQPKFKPH